GWAWRCADGREAWAGVSRWGAGAYAPAYEGQSPPRPEVARRDPAAGRRNRGSEGSWERTSRRRWQATRGFSGPPRSAAFPSKRQPAAARAARPPPGVSRPPGSNRALLTTTAPSTCRVEFAGTSQLVER